MTIGYHYPHAKKIIIPVAFANFSAGILALARLKSLHLFCPRSSQLGCFRQQRNYLFTKTNSMKSQSEFFASVTRPYNSWSDKKMATESLKIQTGFTDNIYFPTPTPSLDDYSAAVGDFLSKLGKAGTRDLNAIAAKNESRKVLIDLSTLLGVYATLTANGNQDMLLSTNLPQRKQPQPVVLGKPSNFRCTNGINPGELLLKIDTMHGVASFNFMYTQYPIQEGATWTTVSSSKSTCLISGLEPGKKYAFRVAAIGTNGQVVWGETLQSPYVQ